MRWVFFAFFLIAITCIGYSQTLLPRIYEYDSGGNRVIRKVIVLNATLPEEDSVYLEQERRTQEDAYYLLEQIEELKTSVYPNPTTSVIRLMIEAENLEHQSIVEVYTLNGRQLQQKHIKNPLTEIDLSSYPKGIYILRLHIGEKQREWKVIKE